MRQNKIGIAFIRGVSMFGNKNYSKGEIMDCLKELEGNKVKFIAIYGNDNVIFKKGNVHYATVGSMIEKCLEKRFGEKFYVTTRSFETIARLVKKFGDEEMKR